MDEGSGSTAADAIGSNDLSLEGAPTWESNTDYEGGYGISLDGTDDYLSYASVETTFSITGTWAYGLTLRKSSAGSAEQLVNQALDDGSGNTDDTWGIYINGGSIEAGFFDGSSFVDTASHTEPSTPYLIRLLIGADNGSLQFYLDTNSAAGTEQPVVGTSPGYFRVGSRIDTDGAAIDYLTGEVDHAIGYNAAPADVVQDDYDLQPWT